MKEGWSYKKLGEVCEIFGRIGFRGYTKADLVDNPDDGAITLSPSNIVNGEMDFRKCSYITWHKYEESPEIKIFPGDILIVKTASVGKTALVKRLPHPSTINPQFVVLKNIRINNLYLSYYLKSQIAQTFIWSIAKGAAAQTVSQKNLAQMLIPVGTLEEQRSIVTRLDAAFSHIDALKANAEKQLNEARKLFQAELIECMKPKEGWEEKKFGEVCSFVRGPFGGSLKKECFVSSGYAVYEQQNAIYNKFTFRYFIDEKKYNSMIRFSVSPGELIMSCSGTIGKVAIIPDGAKKGVINQALLKLSPQCLLDKHYLKYFMESSFFEDLISQYSDGAAIKNIASVAILKNIIISIPPLSIQQAIVSHLDSLSSHIRKLEELQQKTIAECDALKQAMLREVFE